MPFMNDPNVSEIMINRPDEIYVEREGRLVRTDAKFEDDQALEAAVRAYGGLDMLVPNAGVFPKGCPIASLSMAEWRRVMAVNLDANLVLMREAYPAPRCTLA